MEVQVPPIGWLVFTSTIIGLHIGLFVIGWDGIRWDVDFVFLGDVKGREG